MLTIVQLVTITVPMIAGFGWLINFLGSKFNSLLVKLDKKVDLTSCKLRRDSCPCMRTAIDLQDQIKELRAHSK